MGLLTTSDIMTCVSVCQSVDKRTENRQLKILLRATASDNSSDEFSNFRHCLIKVKSTMKFLHFTAT